MAAKTGKSPRAFKHAPSTQTAKLLTVLAEFNPNANDDFSGFERPAFVGAEDCVTEPPGTLLERPAAQQPARPGDLRPRHRQQHLLGARLQPQPLQQAHLHQTAA